MDLRLLSDLCSHDGPSLIEWPLLSRWTSAYWVTSALTMDLCLMSDLRSHDGSLLNEWPLLSRWTFASQGRFTAWTQTCRRGLVKSRASAFTGDLSLASNSASQGIYFQWPQTSSRLLASQGTFSMALMMSAIASFASPFTASPSLKGANACNKFDMVEIFAKLSAGSSTWPPAVLYMLLCYS